MVDAVAMDEPEIEPNIAQPATAAMARPPRQCPIHAFDAANNALEMPVWVARCPMRMNRGTIARS